MESAPRDASAARHAGPGGPICQKADDRALPAGACSSAALVRRQGVPESSSSASPRPGHHARNQLRQTDKGNSILLEWMPCRRARLFLGSMGAREAAETTMVIWTSRRVARQRLRLFDYQTNAAVDKWLKDKVLLTPTDHQVRGTEGSTPPRECLAPSPTAPRSHGLSAAPDGSEDPMGAGLEREDSA